MTEIEQKALALLNELSDYEVPDLDEAQYSTAIQALCRAIEQHEQFKREVSDVAEGILNCTNINKRYGACLTLNRFILPKPVDPLVEALCEMDPDTMPNEADAENLRAALAKRGLEIREIEG